MTIHETVVYLAHLCNDFENQGEHFEFTCKDAKTIANFIDLLFKIQHSIVKTLIVLGIAIMLGLAVYLNYKVGA